jgi:glycerol-3-phosphate dehydrogenase (NAD(P)+)
MAIVTIIGAGMMGTALSWPLCDNHHEVRLVGTPLDDEIIDSIHASRFHPTLQRSIPDGITPYYSHQLLEALSGAELLVSGVSSFGVAWFADTVGRYFDPRVPVLAVTKGLEDQPDGSLLTLPDAINKRLPAHLRDRISLNAIGGPCTAHELAAHRQTCVVFCGKDKQILSWLREIFATENYHIWLSTDVVGVEACAALKNAYALGICLGMGMMEQAGPDGLADMYNPQAALFAQGCLEIGRFLRLLGGGADNVAWLPAPGDLFVTIFGGRTARLGKLLGKGVPFAQAREALAGVTLESVEIITRVGRALRIKSQAGEVDLGDYPLLIHLDRIINQGEPLEIPWGRFFLD